MLMGIKRSGGKIGVESVGKVVAARSFSDEEGTLGTRAHALLKSTPDFMKVRVWNLFLSRHREILTSVRIPWYIPEWLGGVGLPVLEPFGKGIDGENIQLLEHAQELPSKHSPSDLDRRIAQAIMFGWKDRRPKRPVLESSWHVREVSSQRLKGLTPVLGLSDEELSAAERLNGYLAVEALFTSDKDSLYDPRDAVSTLRHNERLWRHYLRQGSLPGPIPDGKLWAVQAHEALAVNHILDMSDVVFDWFLPSSRGM